ncbi:MAG: hypothetical protein GC200_01000 [Tepidisphaera sp.]|nr:hypothetical protein [Tepidisphaera sp.]
MSVDRLFSYAGEAAGSVALEEAALDVLLDQEMARQGVVLPPDGAQAELRALVQSITNEGDITGDQAGVVLERLKRGRGLGPARFQALLTRNAKLRALVSPQVTLSPQDLSTAMELEFGPKVKARLLTVPTRELASDMRTRMTADAADPLTTFARLATLYSTDPSGPSGGVVEPLSAADISLPPALRQAIADPPLGLLPEAVATPRGFTLVYVEEKIPARPAPTDEERQKVEAKARRRLERLAMDRLARQLIDQAKITVLDDGVRWSWETRPK